MVVFAALGQAAGGFLVLGWAYAGSDWLREGGLTVGLVLFGLGLIGCGLALLPTHILSLLCGWSLGLYGGFALAVLTATAASPLGYAIGRALAGPGMIELIRRYPPRSRHLQQRHGPPQKHANLQRTGHAKPTFSASLRASPIGVGLPW